MKGASSRYVVVKYGDLNRGESMNIGILAWNMNEGLDTPVRMRLLDDWGYIHAAFPKGAALEIQADVEKRLTDIKTYGDYRRVWEHMGPYTPFEFTEERAATGDAEPLLVAMWKYFFEERPR